VIAAACQIFLLVLAADAGISGAAAETTERRADSPSSGAASALIADPYRWVWDN